MEKIILKDIIHAEVDKMAKADKNKHYPLAESLIREVIKQFVGKLREEADTYYDIIGDPFNCVKMSEIEQLEKQII